ncbi:MAG: hypothetical protein IJ127_07670 [Afipia sp.]|nr:hypothetical protein [Afipia sp.]
MRVKPSLPKEGIPPILKAENRFLHPKFGWVSITFHPQGLPVRHVVTHGGKRVVGSFPSIKMGRTMPWDSLGERALIHWFEFDNSRVGYLMQPHVLQWSAAGKTYTYVPDAISEGALDLTVHEVKKIHPRVHDAECELDRYAMAASIYAFCGLGFEIVTEGQLTSNAAKLLNYKELAGARFTKFGLAEELVVREYLTAVGEVVMLSNLIAHLAGMLGKSEAVARSVIFAMAVRRILAFDLEKRITPVSSVRLIAPRAPSMRLLNFWENAND